MTTMTTPAEIYKQAAGAIAAGRVKEGCRLAYEAAFAATADAAARHNAPCENDEDAEEFLLWLDNLPYPLGEWHKHYDLMDDDLTPLPDYIAGFYLALSFKEHAENLVKLPGGDGIFYWDRDEYFLYLTAVEGLIDDLKNAHPDKERPWNGKRI